MNPVIYVAEDQPAQADLMHTILKTQKRYQITVFNNGLALYRRAQEDRPDLLILDIMLPVLNGLAITRLLKHHDDFRDIPVLVVSSITDPDIQTRVQHAGADAFLPKPFEVATLLEHVSHLLGESATLRAPTPDLAP